MINFKGCRPKTVSSSCMGDGDTGIIRGGEAEGCVVMMASNRLTVLVGNRFYHRGSYWSSPKQVELCDFDLCRI